MWEIFQILKQERLIFAGQQCHHNTLIKSPGPLLTFLIFYGASIQGGLYKGGGAFIRQSIFSRQYIFLKSLMMIADRVNNIHHSDKDPENEIRATITGKRQQEIRLVIPTEFIFSTNNERYSEVLKKELLKRKGKFPALTLKLRKKGVYHKFP